MTLRECSSHRIDLSELDDDDDDNPQLYLHPVRVSIRRGNGIVHTRAITVDSDLNVTTTTGPYEDWGNRPSGMDMRIDFKEESGRHRTMFIVFHKGSCLLDWVKCPDDE